MMGLIITVHVIACILLITIILIQRGRGGGLVESFSGVESMFGTKTTSFLSRTTTVLSILFFITCLSLAFLSAKQSRSLMKKIKIPETNQPQLQEQIQEVPSPADVPTPASPETPQQETAQPQPQSQTP